MLTDNPLPDFFLLLNNAQYASERADNFELHSYDEDSVAKWRVLATEQQQTTCALIKYCVEHAEAIETTLGKIVERDWLLCKMGKRQHK